MGSVVEEPGHSPSQVVNVIPVLVSGLRQSEERCIIWARRLSTQNPGQRTGVADEPDEALIDRGHPSHASRVHVSVQTPEAGSSPSVCIGVNCRSCSRVPLLSCLRSPAWYRWHHLVVWARKTEVRSGTQGRLLLTLTIPCRPLLATHRPAHRSKAWRSIGPEPMATFPMALSQVHSDNVGMHDPCLPACGCPRNRFLFSQGLHSTAGYSVVPQQI